MDKKKKVKPNRVERGPSKDRGDGLSRHRRSVPNKGTGPRDKKD